MSRRAVVLCLLALLATACPADREAVDVPSPDVATNGQVEAKPRYRTPPPIPAFPEEVPPWPGSLRDVLFVTDRVGYAVGDRVILATFDAGAMWVQQYEGAAEFWQVTFVDRSHGWALGPDGLFATIDGGQLWEPTNSDTPLVSVHFHNASDAWGVAGSDRWQGGPLVATDDGGRTWRPVDAPGAVDDACTLEGRSGWVVLSARGVAARTEDGGRTWRSVALSHWDGGEVQCTDDGGAWVHAFGEGAGGHTSHSLARVEADGRTRTVGCHAWGQPCIEPVTVGLRGGLGPMSSVDGDTAVVIDRTQDPSIPGELARIEQGGAAVTFAPLPAGEHPNAAAFRTGRLGWVVGSIRTGVDWHAAIWGTDDGGTTWTQQYGPPDGA